MEKRNIKLVLSYDGRNYHGWQKQISHPSVQGELEKALDQIFKENLKLDGIGRTDSGAHALSYTANFLTRNHSIPANKILLALNSMTPKDIRIISTEEVQPGFHSRFSAKAREYIYFLTNARSLPPFLSSYCHLEKQDLDSEKLAEICALFTGKHNFKNFCSSYKDAVNFEREIFYFHVKAWKNSETGFSSIFNNTGYTYLFFIKGSSFLKGMIRTIISACISYSLGDIDLKTTKDALDNNTPLEARFRVPVSAEGLYFKRGYF